MNLFDFLHGYFVAGVFEFDMWESESGLTNIYVSIPKKNINSELFNKFLTGLSGFGFSQYSAKNGIVEFYNSNSYLHLETM